MGNINFQGTLMNHSFDVQGMTCGHCVRAVEDAVQALDAQAQVSVDLAAGRVQVQSTQPRAALAAAITEAGYDVAADAAPSAPSAPARSGCCGACGGSKA